MYIKIFIMAFISFVAAYLVVPFIVRDVLKENFIKRLKNANGFCLTFDDGPDPDVTPKVLDVLKKYGAKATFFPVGKNAMKYPFLIERILSEGHEIGCHSYNHRHPMLTGPVATFRDLFEKQMVGKEEAALFRPPYGKLNLVSLLYVVIKRKNVVFWTLDPKDYDKITASEIERDVLCGLKNGTVVLFHDKIRKNLNSSEPVLIKAVETVLQIAEKKGLSSKTISTLLYEKKEGTKR